MSGRDAQSVPWFAEERPQAVLANGARLDGRSFEEFRSVCESSAQRRSSASCRWPPHRRRCRPARAGCGFTAHLRLLAVPPSCCSFEDVRHQPGIWQRLCRVRAHKGGDGCWCRKT